MSVNGFATQAILLALEDAGMKDELDGYIYHTGFRSGPVGTTPLIAAAIGRGGWIVPGLRSGLFYWYIN